MKQNMKAEARKARFGIQYKEELSMRYNSFSLCRLLLILLLPGVFLACQPTPAQDAIVNKGDSVLEAALAATPLPTQEADTINTAEPHVSHWTEFCKINDVDLIIDVPVEWPVSEYPAYEVQPREFRPEDINAIVDYFVPEAVSVRETGYSEQEILENLEAAVRGYWYVNDDGGYYGPYEGQEEDIAYWQEQLRRVSEEDAVQHFEPIDELPARKTFINSDGKEVSVSARGSSWAVAVSLGQLPIIQPESLVIGGTAIGNEPKGTTIENITIRKEEALEEATRFLLDIGYEAFQFSGAEKARMVNGITEDILAAGWRLTFCRNDGGYAPVDYTKLRYSVLRTNTQVAYSKPWLSERIQIFVDEQGIRFAEQAYPIAVNKEINSNVTILPFKSIQEQILKRFQYEFSWGESISSITVERVALIGGLIRMPDHPDLGRIVPTWLVEFSIEEKDLENTDTYFIAINAVDGSDVNILGY